MKETSIILFGDLNITKETEKCDLKVSNIILNTFLNVKEIFNGLYSHYDDKNSNEKLLVDNCDILYKKGNDIVKIKLGKYFKKNLISYLNKKGKIGKRKSSGLSYIDCIDFSNYIMGKETKIVDNNEELYSITEYFNKKIDIKDSLTIPIDFINKIEKKSGDLFTIINIKNKNWHDIIYLGKDLYISKFGSGNIYITNIEELLKYYPSNIICKKNNLFIQGVIGKGISKKFKKFNLNGKI